MSVTPLSTWWLGSAAERSPAARALTTDGETLTYRELAESTRAIAAALAARGVGREDRIVWLGRSTRCTVELVHAAQLVGAALCPLSTRATVVELTVQAQSLRPRIVVCDREHHDRAAAIARAAACEVVVAPMLTAAPRTELHAQGIDPRAPLALLCTSGTTGAPKAVVLSNAACHHSAHAAGRRLGYGPGQAWLAVLPMHHVGGLSILLRAAMFAAEVVLHDGFDAARTRADIIRFSIRHASLVPTMLYRFLELQPQRESVGSSALGECCFLVGGASLSADQARRAMEAGLDVRTTYGMTETASQVTTSERGEAAAFPETAGRALDGTTVWIEGQDHDGYGEIVVGGDTLFSGYFGDDAATRGALRGGELFTGDIGRMDGDGRLYVVSRRTDLIVTGGENVRPDEVERVLESHPAVAEAGVCGIPDQEWGQRVVAVVVARGGAHIDAMELAAWCRGRLAAFKIPRRIEVATSLPRTSGGKLMRNRLRDG